MMLLGNSKRIISSDNAFADVAAIKAGGGMRAQFPQGTVDGEEISDRILGIDL
jgi:hypothetical protein